MRPILRSVLGVVLIIAAVGGLLFSLFGLVSVWRYKPDISAALMDDIGLFQRALDATADGLDSADGSLATSIESMDSLEETLTSTSSAVETSVPMVKTMRDLTRVDLPNMVTNAQTSLEAAQESARIIDGVLTAVANIPFVPRDIYNPPVPLHIALQQVSESMDPLPGALDTIETSMSSAMVNIQDVQAEIDRMADDIREIQNGLEEAQRVARDYQSLLSSLQDRTEGLEQRLPRLLNQAAWALTFTLLWIIGVQLGLFVVGWDLLQRRT